MRDRPDLDLLRIEVDTLWVRDERGRLLRDRRPSARPAPYLVIACNSGGQIAEVGADVPEALAIELRSTVERTRPQQDPSTAPAALDRCAELIRDAFGSVAVSSGPGYWIPPGTTFASDVAIARSDSAKTESLRETPPDRANWGDDEWRQLVDGALGPWAFAVVEERVVAICHSARLWDRGAEAGVWTHPEHRARGYAAAVTAAWAGLATTGGRDVFYSTSADNRSSQRVAARLGLRPIGWTWRLSGGG